MNLFEKLNRLDDSLVESKRLVKKKKLTESLQKKQLKENYQISAETWNNIKNYADLETTTGRDFAYDGPYADEVGSLYGAAIDQYNEAEGTSIEYQASIQNGRGASELVDDFGRYAYRDFETECDELLDFAREATCLEDFMSSLVSYIYSFAEDLEYEEEDYDDDIDEMLTESYPNEMTEFMKWIQEYKNGALWNDFTAEFESEQDPDIGVVLTWLENFDEDAYYDYVAAETYDHNIDETLTEDVVENVSQLDAIANQIVDYTREHSSEMWQYEDVYEYINDLNQRGIWNIPAELGNFKAQDPENITEEEAETFINMLIDGTDVNLMLKFL